jgi:hypothetical protein
MNALDQPSALIPAVRYLTVDHRIVASALVTSGGAQNQLSADSVKRPVLPNRKDARRKMQLRSVPEPSKPFKDGYDNGMVAATLKHLWREKRA